MLHSSSSSTSGTPRANETRCRPHVDVDVSCIICSKCTTMAAAAPPPYTLPPSLACQRQALALDWLQGGTGGRGAWHYTREILEIKKHMTSGAGTLICLPQTQRVRDDIPMPNHTFNISKSNRTSQDNNNGNRHNNSNNNNGHRAILLPAWGCVNKLENTCFSRSGGRLSTDVHTVSVCVCMCVMKISTILCRLHNL